MLYIDEQVLYRDDQVLHIDEQVLYVDKQAHNIDEDVTPQYILYTHMHCTYYTFSPSCTVHTIHTVYNTYYVHSQFPMLRLHLQHLFTLAHALSYISVI